jgi:hypothetical protein
MFSNNDIVYFIVSFFSLEAKEDYDVSSSRTGCKVARRLDAPRNCVALNHPLSLSFLLPCLWPRRLSTRASERKNYTAVRFAYLTSCEAILQGVPAAIIFAIPLEFKMH